jgi:hypothetical protein
MRRIVSRTAVLAISGMLLGWFGALPSALADDRMFYDRDGGAATAVQKTIVFNRAHMLWVEVNHNSRMYEDDFWIDTRPHDPGPEYRLYMYANSDVFGIQQTDTFEGPGWHWSCEHGVVMNSDNFAAGAWSWIGIPQHCLRGPGAVRVHVRSRSRGGLVDDAPNHQFGFTPWVAMG